MKFASSLSQEEKTAALYLAEKHPILWRLIHQEIARLGDELPALEAAARITAAVGTALFNATASPRSAEECLRLPMRLKKHLNS